MLLPAFTFTPLVLFLLLILTGLLLFQFALEDREAEKTSSWLDFGAGSWKLVFDTKYYQEADGYKHFDKRYFNKKAVRNETYRTSRQKLMFKAFDRFCRSNSIEYWIAHGTLLGYYWGEKSLTWDDDIDVQTSLQGLYKLNSHNQEKDGEYFLDVNYNFKYRQFQRANRIDARYIDTTTGLFFDITGLAPTDPKNSSILSCKSPHKYHISDIFPLQEISFEGILTFRPHNYKKILIEEYGAKSLTEAIFHNHKFNNVTMAWEPLHTTKIDDNKKPRKPNKDGTHIHI